MENKIAGNRFESELCQILAEHGWWAHNMSQGKAGQPADIIAVKNRVPVIIDCKLCQNDRFVLSRIEPNQENAMKLWQKKVGNNHCYFALKVSSGDIYMASNEMLKLFRMAGMGTLGIAEIRKFPTLERWLA